MLEERNAALSRTTILFLNQVYGGVLTVLESWKPLNWNLPIANHRLQIARSHNEAEAPQSTRRRSHIGRVGESGGLSAAAVRAMRSVGESGDLSPKLAHERSAIQLCIQQGNYPIWWVSSKWS